MPARAMARPLSGDKPKLGYVQPEDAYRRRIKRLRQEITLYEQQRQQAM